MGASQKPKADRICQITEKSAELAGLYKLRLIDVCDRKRFQGAPTEKTAHALEHEFKSPEQQMPTRTEKVLATYDSETKALCNELQMNRTCPR
jgi:hypothetical protein